MDGIGVRAIEPSARTLAKTLFVALLVMGLGLLGLPGALLGEAQAQEGPSIKWWNPSSLNTEIAKGTTDMDNAYHFVTTTRGATLATIVEYEMEPSGGGNIHALGPAERVGTSDTWELYHDMEGISTGTYTLRATMYEGLTPVAHDELAVTVRSSAWNSVEIVYPSNARGLGFYVNPTSGAATFVVDAVSSSDTWRVDLYYTQSQPGSAPSWTACGRHAPEGNFSGGDVPEDIPSGSKFYRMRCDIAGTEEAPAQNTALNITGVAAQAVYNEVPQVGSPLLENPETTDAHRVFPYGQVPNQITLAAATTTAAAGSCTGNFTATVLDQNGRLVPGAKVDIHAQGPTDNLKFATGGNGGRTANQAPNGGGHTRKEHARNCSDNTFVANGQAEHDIPGAYPQGADIKHVQSAPAGTDKNGRFIFAFYSPEGGTTQFTVWADVRADDRHCEDEPSVNGSIGWGTDAPGATGVPHDPDAPCPGDPTGEFLESGPCAGYMKGSRTERVGGGGEVIVGTDDGDELIGTDGDDLICGLGGDDLIRGLAGDDTIYGGPGDDTIYGGRGDDEIYGNLGHDTIYGGAGSDRINGGWGRDVIRGGSGHDILLGHRGHDQLYGGPGDDELYGGRGNDVLRAGRGNDFMKGGPGNDRCGGPGNNRMVQCN